MLVSGAVRPALFVRRMVVPLHLVLLFLFHSLTVGRHVPALHSEGCPKKIRCDRVPLLVTAGKVIICPAATGRLVGLTTKRRRMFGPKRAFFIFGGLGIVVVMTALLALTKLVFYPFYSFYYGGAVFALGLALLFVGLRMTEYEEDEPDRPEQENQLSESK